MPVGGGEVGVEHVALQILVLVEYFLEMMVLDVEHDIRIHLDEAAIGIIGETRVAGAVGERLDGHVVEAEIEHRIHHARHRGAGAGAHRDEERICVVAEAAAGEPPDMGERRLDGGGEIGGIGLLVRVEIGADFRRDGEARRHRQAEVGHFGEIGALAAEEVAHLAGALRFAVTECVDPLRHVSRPGKRCVLETCVPRASGSPRGVGHVHADPRFSRRKSRQ